MRAEIAKLRYLPTPRWMVIVSAGLALLIAAGVVIDAPADVNEYDDAALAGSLVSTICTLVLGVWIVGVEYGQGTMRRMVAAVPARLTLLGSKLVVMLTCVTVGTVIVIAAYWAVIAAFAAVVHGVSVSAEELPDELGGQLVFNTGIAFLAFTVALLTRSMAGGIAVTLIVALVVDSAIGALPAVGDYTFGQNLGDLSDHIRGNDVDAWGEALAITLAWLVALTAASCVWFDRQDVK